MKNFKFIAAIVFAIIVGNVMAKGFDYSTLENKVLYIPELDVDAKYAKKMMKKGKYEKLESTEAKVEYYNNNWKEAMSLSSYNATDYEIRAFDYKKMVKSKDPKAMVMRLYEDDYGNLSVQMVSVGPKKAHVVATHLINGIDLTEASEIRFMMNLLNYQLQENIEIWEAESKVKYSGMRSKYKENVAKFGADISSKTFLIPPVKHKKPEKQKAKQAEIEEAMKIWNISEYKFVSEEELEEIRLEEDPNSFYVRSMPVYNQTPVPYNMNMIITTKGDEVVIAFLGAKKLKASKVDDIQRKITKKIAKFSN